MDCSRFGNYCSWNINAKNTRYSNRADGHKCRYNLKESAVTASIKVKALQQLYRKECCGRDRMKVVLDTTVFENGFNSRSAEVPLLKSFLTRTQSELCIPSVVYHEALNRVRKRATDANSRIDSLHRLTGGEEGFHKVKADDVLHSYDESLKRLLQDLSARILSYPVVAHEELVKRSLVPTKPFVEGGRGY
jgi:PIN domain